MQHPPEKPTIVDRANSTVSARKRNSLQHKLKAYQESEYAREAHTGKNTRRRPKPSMPSMPWDKDPSE
jgi:hypothetical protein